MRLAPSINDVCKRALRKIGEYALRASGPRPEAMEEARYWLDMVVAHVATLERTWWLIPRTGTFPLIPGQREYNLVDALGPAQAADGIEFVVAIMIVNAASGNLVNDVNMLRRIEYEQLKAHDPAASGAPSACYIDRDRTPTVHFLEVPDDALPYQAKVVFQGFAPSLLNGTDNERMVKFRDGWQLFLVTALAAQIGDGPVRKLPADETHKMRADAERLLQQLQAYDAHEHQTEHRVRFHNLG
jgi:hypothetical protein